jgi:hypothetical protein
MRRAIALVGLLLSGAALLAVSVLASEDGGNRINAIGLIDYTTKPRFKVGDWVKYHVIGSSELGMHDDYVMTVLIAGEEDFWGDPGFWVETWMDTPDAPPQTMATLMSYKIFEDTAAFHHMQVYQRKTISNTDINGVPLEVIPKPTASSLKSRTLFQKPLMWDVDTLEADTVVTPAGTFHARKVSTRQGVGATATIGDSSRYDETRDNRVTWMSPEVPITHVAKETIENIIARRTWMIGRSGEASPLLTRDKGLGTARLIAFGSGGLEPRFVPKGRRLPGPAHAAPAAVKTSAPAKRR